VEGDRYGGGKGRVWVRWVWRKVGRGSLQAIGVLGVQGRRNRRVKGQVWGDSVWRVIFGD